MSAGKRTVIPDYLRQKKGLPIRQKKVNVWRYFSLVPPLKQVLVPDGLLAIEEHEMTTPRGHLSYGYVIYDHKLPALQRKAYRLEQDGMIERAASYPEMRNADPEELRTVMELLQEKMNRNPYAEKPKKRTNQF